MCIFWLNIVLQVGVASSALKISCEIPLLASPVYEGKIPQESLILLCDFGRLHLHLLVVFSLLVLYIKNALLWSSLVVSNRSFLLVFAESSAR